jgi:hypothetical protein
MNPADETEPPGRGVGAAPHPSPCGFIGTGGNCWGMAGNPGKRVRGGEKSVEKLWRSAWRNRKGLTTRRRKSLCCLVPETGLEPALPLQEPGPQPGLSAKLWYCRGVDVMLQVVKEHWLTACKLFIDIVLMYWSDCQYLYQIFTIFLYQLVKSVVMRSPSGMSLADFPRRPRCLQLTSLVRNVRQCLRKKNTMHRSDPATLLPCLRMPLAGLLWAAA